MWLHWRRSSIIKYIGWSIQWTVGLFLWPFLSFLSGLTNKVAMVAEMENMHGINNMDLYYRSWCGYSCWVKVLLTVETNIEPPVWHHLLVSDLVVGLLHCITFIMGISVLWLFPESIILLFLDLLFLLIMFLAKLTPIGLQNALSTIMVYYTALLLTKKFTSQSKSNGLMFMEFTGIVMSSTVLSIWIDKMMEWLCKDTCTEPIRWYQYRGLGQGSSDGSMCFESLSNICYYFS